MEQERTVVPSLTFTFRAECDLRGTFPARAARLDSGTIVLQLGCITATLQEWSTGAVAPDLPPRQRRLVDRLRELLVELYAKEPGAEEPADPRDVGRGQPPEGSYYAMAPDLTEGLARASLDRREGGVPERAWIAELERIHEMQRRTRDQLEELRQREANLHRARQLRDLPLPDGP